MPDKFEDLHLSDLSLEPLPDPNLLKYDMGTKAEGKAKFQAESRNKKVTDRRVNPDRRKVLRFQADRRTGKDRRPVKTWDPGKNI
jgi:hypothetical protein